MRKEGEEGGLECECVIHSPGSEGCQCGWPSLQSLTLVSVSLQLTWAGAPAGLDWRQREAEQERTSWGQARQKESN